MKRSAALLLAIGLLLSSLFLSCKPAGENTNNPQGENTPTGSEGETAQTVDTEKTDIPEILPEGKNELSITCTEGTDACWQWDGNVLTFAGLQADTVCSVSGSLNGQICIDAGEDFRFELEFCGVTLYSTTQNPIEILSGKEVTLTAKKGSKNFIYDTRKAVSETERASAVYAACDLSLGGKGELTVISENNNGIHAKDTLQVKNVTLSVTCRDNALKGNDGVEISGGVLTLIAKAGDGVKTTNTSLSAKGNQRGTISVTAGTVTVYAACDGMDAAYDTIIADEAMVMIYTDKYSPYSETVEKTAEAGGENVRYIRFTSKNYNYAVKYYNSDSDYVWAKASYATSVSGGRSTYYYYSFDKRTDYASVQFFIYSSGQTPGQEEEYAAKSDYMTWNTAYDTFALEARGNSLSYNWTNYSTSIDSGFGGMGGGPGGMGGGMMDGNSEKGAYSTKGIKAGNEIRISGGTVQIEAYDDALHANNETALENGSTATGNVVISGGTLTLFSKDDGIHADGTVTVEGGTISITNCYEGLEGVQVIVRGGNVSVVSSDDGINATATTGKGILFEGGKVYIYAGGDGIDANSRTSYQGIVFAGGEITVVSTSSMNSSIDTEQGYTYTGGTVLALCPSNGMGSESSKCQNFSTVGTKTTKSLKQGQTLQVKVNGEITASVVMPCQLSALVIYLGSSDAVFVTE